MFEDMAPEEATTFATKLLAAADSVERTQAELVRTALPGLASVKGQVDTVDLVIAETGSTVRQALTAVRQAARWYEKVGKLGYGVRAWS